MSRFVINVQKFYNEAEELRGVFERNYENPRSAHSERFVWDYWHVPDQYTLLRTPAWEYFPEELYLRFHESLVKWGRETLGCWDVSPPWLSLYVEGCQQSLHTDVPHGPWAFVYSLSPKRLRFQGGETMILKPGVLNYWPQFNDAEDREQNSYLERIPSKFNRLTVFDPRFPHGVTRLSGTHDPREGRLVLHGWFTEPKPFVAGPLKQEQIDSVLESELAVIAEITAETGPYHGMLSARMTIEKTGQVSAVKSLANTLVCMDEPELHEKSVTRKILAHLKKLTFAKSKGKTQLTLPLLFR